MLKKLPWVILYQSDCLSTAVSYPDRPRAMLSYGDKVRKSIKSKDNLEED